MKSFCVLYCAQKGECQKTAGVLELCRIPENQEEEKIQVFLVDPASLWQVKVFDKRWMEAKWVTRFLAPMALTELDSWSKSAEEPSNQTINLLIILPNS